MSDEKTQKTPKGHEIPVPKKRAVWDALRKVGKAKPKNGSAGRPE